MSTNTPIVVGVDGSAGSDVAVAWATRAATVHGAPLHLLHFLDPIADYGPGVTEPLTAVDYERLNEHGRFLLDNASAEVKAASTGAVPPVTTELVRGATAPALVDRSENARMVVVGTRERGTLRRALLGSVSSVLVRRAHCPVAVVKEGMRPTPELARRPVVVGIDGTATSGPAVEAAFAEASAREVELIAVHVWTGPEMVEAARRESGDDQDEQVLLAEGLAGHRERFPEVRVRREIVRDLPERYLSECSRDAQLLVVGSRGRGGFASMLLGSTSQALLLAADCPLLVVRESE